jgi:uncharacterized protein YjbJ (UPF0337 family)
MWNKDEIAGKGKKIEGAVKETVGEFVTNPDLEAAGKAERFKGILQEKTGELHRNAAGLLEKADKAISGK